MERCRRPPPSPRTRRRFASNPTSSTSPACTSSNTATPRAGGRLLARGAAPRPGRRPLQSRARPLASAPRGTRRCRETPPRQHRPPGHPQRRTPPTARRTTSSDCACGNRRLPRSSIPSGWPPPTQRSTRRRGITPGSRRFSCAAGDRRAPRRLAHRTRPPGARPARQRRQSARTRPPGRCPAPPWPLSRSRNAARRDPGARSC
jgi:hypothetical protein